MLSGESPFDVANRVFATVSLAYCKRALASSDFRLQTEPQLKFTEIAGIVSGHWFGDQFAIWKPKIIRVQIPTPGVGVTLHLRSCDQERDAFNRIASTCFGDVRVRGLHVLCTDQAFRLYRCHAPRSRGFVLGTSNPVDELICRSLVIYSIYIYIYIYIYTI